MGMSDEELLALPSFRSSPHFSEPEKVALEYAEAMCTTPVDVPDELFARVKQHFSDNQIVELTASIAFENYRARFDHALGIGSDQLYACAWPPQARPQHAAAGED